jgi:hypothetical protein
MKTAIQELMDWANQYKGQMISADQVVLQAHNLLKKEKEQIMDAHLEGWSDAYDYLKSDSNDQARQAEDYYNQTYNN